MVSFQCDACQDVVKKPKLDNHRARCNASFTCIDCSTTFAGPHQYKAHTSCISEAQKYEKGLYKGAKGKPATNGGNPNGRQNGRESDQSNEPKGPNGVGTSAQATKNDVKTTDSQPNPSASLVKEDAAPSSEPASTEATGQANLDTNETASGKKKKQKKKREPPPPGETRAERKKRKKVERAAKKVEKLRLKAQMKAAKAEALAAKRREKLTKQREEMLAMPTRSAGPAPEISLPEDTTPNATVPAPESPVEEPQVQSSKSKKRKHLEEVNGDLEMQAEPTEDSGKGEKKKKKKKSKEEKTETSELAAMEVDTTEGDEAKAEKKSKKRKREVEDVGGKEAVEEMVELSFKERAKAEKKARKAEKKARKALEAEAS